MNVNHYSLTQSCLINSKVLFYMNLYKNIKCKLFLQYSNFYTYFIVVHILSTRNKVCKSLKDKGVKCFYFSSKKVLNTLGNGTFFNTFVSLNQNTFMRTLCFDLIGNKMRNLFNGCFIFHQNTMLFGNCEAEATLTSLII